MLTRTHKQSVAPSCVQERTEKRVLEQQLSDVQVLQRTLAERTDALQSVQTRVEALCAETERKVRWTPWVVVVVVVLMVVMMAVAERGQVRWRVVLYE